MAEGDRIPTKKKRKKGCFSKLLNLLFLAALIIGGYYGYLWLADNYFPDQENNQNQESQENGANGENEENVENGESANDSQNTDNSENYVGNSNAIEVSITEIDKNPTERINFQKIGTVSPYKSVTLTSQSSGTISNFSISEGDNVEENQKIADITDSVSTEIAQINYETALKNLELSRQSLASTEDSINQDIKNAEIGVETAILNYNNTVNSYNNLVATLEEQMRQAVIGVQAAQIGLQSAQESYFNSQTSSNLLIESTIDQALSGVSSSFSLIDSSLDVSDSIFVHEDTLDNYVSNSRFSGLEDDIDDARDRYYDLYDDYERLRNSDNLLSAQNLLYSVSDLLEDTEDILYESKYIIDDALNYDDDEILNISSSLNTIKTNINTMLPSIDQSRSGILMSANSIDSQRLTAQIQPEGSLNQVEAAQQQLTSAYQGIEQTEANQKTQLDNAQHAINLANQQLASANAQLENIRAKGNLQIIGAESQLVMQEGQTNIANANLKGTEVISPINGVILNKLIEEGNYTNPSQKIVTIADMSKVKIIVSLTTEELSFIKLGQDVIIEAPGNIKVKGKITKVHPSLDPVSKKVDIEIILSNGNGDFKSGMFTDVLFIDAQKDTPSIYIPFKSIVFDRSIPKVFIVENGKAVKKEVELGQLSGNQVEIKSGLNKGDRVITDGAKLVTDGQAVTISD